MICELRMINCNFATILISYCKICAERLYRIAVSRTVCRDSLVYFRSKILQPLVSLNSLRPSDHFLTKPSMFQAAGATFFFASRRHVSQCRTSGQLLDQIESTAPFASCKADTIFVYLHGYFVQCRHMAPSPFTLSPKILRSLSGLYWGIYLLKVAL